MTTTADFILNEALSMRLDQPADENVGAEWIQLAQKRLAELENGSIKLVSWESIKQKGLRSSQ